jgi:hypothetical protein
MDKDSNLAEHEFAIAMHLIMASLAGQELPAAVPQPLLQSVAAVRVNLLFVLSALALQDSLYRKR